jgi:hypothetical protein
VKENIYVGQTDRPLQVQITEHKRNAEIEEPSDLKELKALGMTIIDYIKIKQKAPTEMEKVLL